MGKTSQKNVLAGRVSPPYLEQVLGPDKGKIFELLADQLAIGRTPDNDIVIESHAVSRNHAILDRTREGFFKIRDNGSKNGIQVNGKLVIELRLTHGDLIQIGDFAFRFNEPDLTGNADPESQAGYPIVDSFPSQSRRPLLYGILFIILGLVAWFHFSQGPEEKSGKKDSDDQITAEMGGADTTYGATVSSSTKIAGLEDPALTRAEQQLKVSETSDLGSREAEQYFRRGQREYLNKNYHRAIEAFQAALAFQHNHVQAKDYLRLAVREAEAEAKKHQQMAIRYFESLQYSRAIYHFTEVINLMSHRVSDPMIIEAEKYIGLAKRRMEAAELFP